MKICFVTSSFTRDREDCAAIWLVTLIQKLALKGAEVRVFAPAYKGLGDHTLFGIDVRRFRYAPAALEDLTHEDSTPQRMNHFSFKLLVLSYIVCGCLASLFYFARNRFDVAHVHWPFPQLLFALPAKFLGGSRVVCHFHGSDIFLLRDRPFIAAVLAFLLRYADAIVANSTGTKEAVESTLKLGREIQVIPLGSSLPATASAREMKPPYKLFFAGKLIERKGAAYLLRAMAKLRELSFPAGLVIAGDGPLRAELENLVKDLGLGGRVEFKGFLPAGSAALSAEYAACDAFIFPSIADALGNREGLGVSAIEAMMIGRPVIAFDSGGIRDIVRDGETGWLVQEKDSDALAGKIIEVCSDPAAARAVALRGKEAAEKAFSWDSVVERFLKVYHP